MKPDDDGDGREGEAEGERQAEAAADDEHAEAIVVDAEETADLLLPTARFLLALFETEDGGERAEGETSKSAKEKMMLRLRLGTRNLCLSILASLSS